MNGHTYDDVNKPDSYGHDNLKNRISHYHIRHMGNLTKTITEKRLIVMLSAILVVLFLLLAMYNIIPINSSNSSTGTPHRNNHTVTSVNLSGTVTVGYLNDFSGLNPLNPLDTTAMDVNLYSNFLDSLTVTDGNGTTIMLAATDILHGPDYKNWTVTFNNNMTWAVPYALTVNSTARSLINKTVDAMDIFVSYQAMINSPVTDSSLKYLAVNPSGNRVKNQLISNMTDGQIDRSPPAGVLVANITMPDGPSGYMVEFHLYQPDSMFVSGVLNKYILPAPVWMSHMWGLTTVPTNSYNASVSIWNGGEISTSTGIYFLSDIGSGTFVQGGWTPDVGAIINANKDYWMKSSIPSIKSVEFILYGSMTSLVAALVNNQIDLIDGSVPSSYITEIDSTPNLHVAIMPQLGYTFLSFNLRKPPYNSVLFRHAISHIVNRSFIFNKIINGYGITGTNVISPISNEYYNNSVNYEYPYTYSTYIAEKDISKIPGMSLSHGNDSMPGPGNYWMYNGTELYIKLLVPISESNPLISIISQYIQQWMQSIGLDVMVIPTNLNALISDISTAPYNFDMYLLNWNIMSLNPTNTLESLFDSNQTPPAGSNYEGFRNGSFDILMHDANTEMNIVKRITDIKNAEGILGYQLPYVLLYFSDVIEAYSTSHFTGWDTLYPVGYLPILNRWSLCNIVPAHVNNITNSSSIIHNAMYSTNYNEPFNINFMVRDKADHMHALKKTVHHAFFVKNRS
ncbi:MAG: ABC transporter substrate-binding protein [Candidatus Thermoplasmatota archaeon]|nr:ABC transporter substrate-binding protein [Candidatus Thermoplasmatota archaeon]